MAFVPQNRNRRVRIDQAPELSFNEFEQKRFVENVLNGDYMLVIGSEVMMTISEDVSSTGDVNDYILKCVNTTLKEDGLITENYKTIDDVIRKTKDGIDPIWNLLNNEDFKNSMIESDLSEELRAMLDLKLFPIIITTTFDSYLEKYLRKLWGESLRVVNIFDDKSLSDFRNRLNLYQKVEQYREPTLIYAFGKVEQDESKFYARTEDDYMLVIEQWFCKISNNNDLIYSFLTNENKRLLALGCKFDNWYFRFFWRILRRKDNVLKNGMVAIPLDSTDSSEQKLQRYLDHIRVYNHNESRTFMKRIVNMMTDISKGSLFRDIIIQNRKKKGVFISYKGTDSTFAMQLFEMIRRKFNNVWFDDERIDGGDNYMEIIREGILNASVFIALLGSGTAEDLKQEHTSNVYNAEWRWAAERKGELAIIPVAINKYNLREDYHHLFEQITQSTVSGISLMDPDGFNRLIVAIEKHLNV